MDKTPEISTPFMEAKWVEAGILSVKSLSKKPLDIDGYKDHYNLFFEFLDSQGPCKILIDASESVAIPRSLRKSIQEHLNRHATKVAVYSHNPLGVTIAKLSLTISKPKVPTKTFHNKKEALNWLKRIDESRL